MEAAIYPYSHKDGTFSAPGGSESVLVADCRIVGILTGGASQTDSTDLTYVSPYYWVHERIKEAFPNATSTRSWPRSQH